MANPLRTTMATLIARVRTLIADPAGASQQFDDLTIQNALDDHRTFVGPVALLMPEPKLTVGGILNYSDYFANVGDWEAFPATSLLNPSFQTLTPATADEITGHWTFNISPGGQYPPVYIRGYYYDRYASAADLLETWAAAYARSHDFAAGQNKFSVSQAYEQMLKQATTFRRKARPKTAVMERGDDGEESNWPINTMGATGWIS